jgi:methionyl-tRNA synthetase
MIAKNCDGKIPQPGQFADTDRDLLTATDALHGIVREAMDRQNVKHYLDAVWGVVADANRYFASEQPWSKKTTEPERMATILYVAAEVVRQVAILVQPVTPTAAARLLDILGPPADARSFAALGADGRLRPGTAIPEPTGVFPRYVDPEESKERPPKPGKGKSKS